MSKLPHTKEEVYQAVLNSAIELEIQLGHQKWTYTLLSKKSAISRTLIYYYFGKEKINILQEACRLFGEVLAGSTEERMQAWEDDKIEIGLNKTRDLFAKYPYLVPFYFLNRSKENQVGELIRKYEKDGHTKRKKFFPNLSESELRVLYSFHLGLVSFPHLIESDVKAACQILKKSFT